MDKHIPQFYRDYGRYINRSRAFPSELDGLKVVERRVLLSAYETCRDSFAKSSKLVGYIIGEYHPHGDTAAYGTIVQLANQNFLDKQGNFGSSIGIEPCEASAHRYTETKLNPNIKNIAFKLIDYVKREDSELEPEPPFLPTMYPFCLMGTEYTVGIGFGYKTVIPCYEQADLKKRLLYLIGKTKKAPIIRPITDSDIISNDATLNELLTTGKSVVEFKGRYTIDKEHHKISIKSIPPGNSFDKLFLKLRTEFESGEIGYADLSENSETNVVIEVIRQRNKDEIFKKFLEKIDPLLIGRASFELIVVGADGKVKNMSVDELLLTVFHNFKKVTDDSLRIEILKLNSKIDEYNLLNRIKPQLVKLLKTTDNFEEICTQVSSILKEDVKRVSDIMIKNNIKRLVTSAFDVNELKLEKTHLEGLLSDLDNYVIMQY